jgi:protocatechuate 3,4-dioxygenase beta subunit
VQGWAAGESDSGCSGMGRGGVDRVGNPAPPVITLPRALALLAVLALLLVGRLWCVRRDALPLPEIDRPAAASPAVASAALEGDGQLASRSEVADSADAPARAKSRRPALLKGTVHGQDGALLEKAVVQLVRNDTPSLVDTAITDERGAFQLRYPVGGDYEVVASAKGQGVSELQSLALPDDAQTLDPLELAIAEPNFLAGVLEDNDGRPLAGVELWAFPATFTAADSQWLFAWRLRPASHSPRGECSASTLTDRAGRFRFDGLAPGRYFVARETELDPPHGVRWSHRTGEDALRIVEEHCWLRIRCGEQGAARAFCAPLLAGGPSDALLEPLDPSESGAGALYEVEPCRVYRCGFFEPAGGLVEAEVSIPNRAVTIEKSFELPPAGAAGTLKVEMPSFLALAEQHPRRVRLRSGASGVLLKSWTQTGDQSLALVAGAYVLEVAEPPARGWEILPRADPLGEALLERRTLAIEAGSVTRIEVRD